MKEPQSLWGRQPLIERRPIVVHPKRLCPKCQGVGSTPNQVKCEHCKGWGIV